MNKDSRRNESAEEALKQIVDGFNRFRNEVYPEQQELFKKLAHEQDDCFGGVDSWGFGDDAM